MSKLRDSGTVKGSTSRAQLIQAARKVFNRVGIGITIDSLARELGVSKGKITNHFPTKDLLFLGVLAEYERELAETSEQFGWGVKEYSFTNLLTFLSLIMDVQFRYRCAMAYVAMITQEQSELHGHVLENFRRNASSIRGRLHHMVNRKSLKATILEPEHLEPFILAYVNLMTFWVVSATLYHNDDEYPAVKTNCLRAVVSLYKPYLTASAVKELRSCGYLSE